MSKIIVDSIQKNGGVPLTVPAADGTAGQVIKTDGSGQLGFVDLPPTPINTTIPDDSEFIIGSVISNSARNNVYSTGEWSSSGPWTTYYHSWQDANSITQGWNMFMGDGVPNGTSQPMFVNDGENAMTRVKEYANGDRLGNQQKDYFYYDNITSNYAGVTWRCTPIRNTTSAAVTRTLSVYLSSYDTSYGGACIFTYTPDATTYAGTTGGTWQSNWNGGTNTASTNRTGSITIPANTTVLVFTLSTHQYATTYRFKDSNMLSGLATFFGTELVCDLRMLETLATARVGHYDGVTNTVTHPWYIYPLTATMYGDR
jgi:hypothetical protein